MGFHPFSFHDNNAQNTQLVCSETSLEELCAYHIHAHAFVKMLKKFNSNPRALYASVCAGCVDAARLRSSVPGILCMCCLIN